MMAFGAVCGASVYFVSSFSVEMIVITATLGSIGGACIGYAILAALNRGRFRPPLTTNRRPPRVSQSQPLESTRASSYERRPFSSRLADYTKSDPSQDTRPNKPYVSPMLFFHTSRVTPEYRPSRFSSFARSWSESARSYPNHNTAMVRMWGIGGRNGW